MADRNWAPQPVTPARNHWSVVRSYTFQVLSGGCSVGKSTVPKLVTPSRSQVVNKVSSLIQNHWPVCILKMFSAGQQPSSLVAWLSCVVLTATLGGVPVSAQDFGQSTNNTGLLFSPLLSCTNSSGAAQACTQFPPISLASAPLTIATASSVCSNEEFCTTNSARVTTCSNCTAQYSASNLVDGLSSDARRWQSANLATAQDDVVIDLSFGLTNVIPVAMELSQTQQLNTLTPASIDIFTSNDGGQTFTPAGYFRQDCIANPSLSPCVNIPTDRSSLGLSLRSLNDIARAFRLNSSLHTLVGSNPFVTHLRVVFRELADTRFSANQSLFYSLTEIRITAMPFCNGHASTTNLSSEAQTCMCEHGASGTRCELCNGEPFPLASLEIAPVCSEYRARL